MAHSQQQEGLRVLHQGGGHAQGETGKNADRGLGRRQNRALAGPASRNRLAAAQLQNQDRTGAGRPGRRARKCKLQQGTHEDTEGIKETEEWKAAETLIGEAKAFLEGI